VAKKPYIIALEEHYLDPEVKQLGGGPGAGCDIFERLDDLGALRIREMDEAGIDLQVLSHSIPGLQAVDADRQPARGSRRTGARRHQLGWAPMDHGDFAFETHRSPPCIGTQDASPAPCLASELGVQSAGGRVQTTTRQQPSTDANELAHYGDWRSRRRAKHRDEVEVPEFSAAEQIIFEKVCSPGPRIGVPKASPSKWD
jgi:hypothetical protein